MNMDLMRKAVQSYYDAQKLRIQMSNRIDAQARAGTMTREWEEQAEDTLKDMVKIEKKLQKDVGTMLTHVDIYPWLTEVRGCGVLISGALVSGIQDPGKFETVSKLWAYCGLHVVEGRAPRRRKGEKANWNGFLKAKLLGVLGPQFLKHKNETYSKIYYDEKHRLDSLPCSLSPAEHRKGAKAEDLLPNGCTAGHMHNKAIRKMVKIFLADFWEEWRTMRGLPVRPTYQEEYLGHKHAG